MTVGRPLRVTLQPAGIAETVTVTAARSLERIADTATATSILAAPALLTSANMTVDDALRSVPGFSLFRRSSSRVANPTTQGATLRGLSASGASRALADGMPLDDPYGGWVYWVTPGRASLTADWRALGLQYDDDRNVYQLRPAPLLDLYAGATVGRGVQPFIAIENVFDEEMDVGRTPVRTIGTPRSLRAGVRMFVPQTQRRRVGRQRSSAGLPSRLARAAIRCSNSP